MAYIHYKGITMTKNFFEYVKELVPEKGSVFFTQENHTTANNISLYSVAKLLSGESLPHIQEVTAYSWNVEKAWHYFFPTMGLMFLYEDGSEKWIHFSKHAFIGTVCIMAIKNDIEFDEPYYEDIRQAWMRKLNKEEACDYDRFYTDLENEESNFDDDDFLSKPDIKEMYRAMYLYKHKNHPYDGHEKVELKERWEPFDHEYNQDFDPAY